MDKLLKLKQWLTVADATRHLSILFGEAVSEADVLRLALDGHLTLSVHFLNGVCVRGGPVIALSEEFHLEHSVWLDENTVIDCGPELKRLVGVWDLSMRGSERTEIENRYQSLTNGPVVGSKPWPGLIVCQEDGPHYQIQRRLLENDFIAPATLKAQYYHEDNYCQADGLPADSVIVIRTSALHDLEARVSKPDQRTEKPLEQRERTSLLGIIAALAKLAKIDVTKPSSAAAAIESHTVRIGARVASRTIENHLKLIPEALERLSK